MPTANHARRPPGPSRSASRHASHRRTTAARVQRRAAAGAATTRITPGADHVTTETELSRIMPRRGGFSGPTPSRNPGDRSSPRLPPFFAVGLWPRYGGVSSVCAVCASPARGSASRSSPSLVRRAHCRGGVRVARTRDGRSRPTRPTSAWHAPLCQPARGGTVLSGRAKRGPPEWVARQSSGLAPRG